MKENISTTIAGQVYHIETEAYQKLSAWLKDIKTYFNQMDDGQEILADIELRVAEILSQRLLQAHKQVVGTDDVEAVIKRMGLVSEIAAETDEETQNLPPNEPTAKNKNNQKQPNDNQTSPHWVRDIKRKKVGGVAAGLAHLLQISPVWIRLGLLALIVGLAYWPGKGISMGIVVAYLVLWIVLPASGSLPETPEKSLFRDPRHKTLGGVCSGLAAYFGVEILPLRLLFVVLLLLGGLGFWLYIVFWIITPQARTPSERMRMQGKPFNLKNLEDYTRQKFNIDTDSRTGQQSSMATFTVALVTGLRKFGDWLERVVPPLWALLSNLLRWSFGLAILGFGLFMVAGIYGFVLKVFNPGFVLFDSAYHFSNHEWLFIKHFVNNGITESYSYLLVSIVALPFMLPVLAGIKIIVKQKLNFKWLYIALGFVWLGAVAAGWSQAYQLYQDLKTPGLHTKTITLTAPDVAVFGTIHNQKHLLTDRYIQFMPHADTNINVQIEKKAYGPNLATAQHRAKHIAFDYQQQGSTIQFSEWPQLPDTAKFARQQMHVTVFVPKNKPFVISPSMSAVISNTLSKGHFDASYLTDSTLWVFDSAGINCLNCAETARQPGNWAQGATEYKVQPFSEISIEGGNHRVYIKHEPRHTVFVKKPESESYRLEIENDDDELTIDTDHGWIRWGNAKPAHIYITTPNIQAIEGTGAQFFRLYDLDVPALEVRLLGACKLSGQVVASQLNFDFSGNSSATLSGQADHLQANLSGACDLVARKLTVRHANIEASGASNAYVTVTERIDAEASGASDIEYAGRPPQKQTRTSGAADITPVE